MGRVLYHYTDYVAMSGIITKAELRVNNVLNMNDASEMSFFIKRVTDEIIKKLSPELRDKILEDKDERISYYEDPRFQHSGYAACFSLFEDDAAQWERYGNRGRGVCIGFDEDNLRKILVPGLALENVYYNSDEKCREISDVFLKLVSGHENEILEENVSDELSRSFDNLIKRAWICSVIYKHPSFVCENEVRLVFWPELAGLASIEPGYHVTSERIKKYYPLDLKELCLFSGVNFEDLFVSIKVGPESIQSPEILADYLHHSGFPALAERIVKSECPLRTTLKG